MNYLNDSDSDIPRINPKEVDPNSPVVLELEKSQLVVGESLYFYGMGKLFLSFHQMYMFFLSTYIQHLGLPYVDLQNNILFFLR